MSDLKYALRTLGRSPGFSMVAILSLALGIGATAAISSVVRAVLLDPLPVHAPEELVAVGWNTGTVRTRGLLSIASTAFRDERSGLSFGSNFSYALFRGFRQAGGADVFGFSYAAQDVSVSFAGQPVVATSLLVSGNFFSVLGVPTVVGRPLNDLDDGADAPPAAVLTYGFWKRALGGDPAVLQRTIRVNGSAFTIVGVTTPPYYGMSKGGPFFRPTDVILPLSAQPLVYTRSTPPSLFDADDRWWVQVMARVTPGAPAAHLEAALDTVFRTTLAAASIPALRDASVGHVRLFAAPRGLDSWARGLRQPLVVLGSVIAVVLLIACVNVGNLMLVRGVARQKELSIRIALGCSRGRVVRGVLVEIAVLTLAGGTLGLLVALWGARSLIATIVGGAIRTAIEISVDARLLGVTAAASTLAALLFGVVPALWLSVSRIAPVLKQVTAGANARHVRAGHLLMVAQVAISIPLLAGAALFVRTVHNLGQVDLGFNPQRLLIFRLDPSLNGYGANRVERLYAEVLQRLDAMPGVDSVTLTDIVLISRLQNNWTFLVPGSEPKTVKFARVGPAYFETFGIPIVAGRSVGVQDHSRAPRVAVVNETAARTLFGSDPAMGQRLSMRTEPPSDFEIVGIVKDSRYTSPRDPMPPTVYLPYGQTTLGRLGPMNVAVRSAVPTTTLARQIASAMADVDPNVPIADLKTQEDQIEETMGTERTFVRLLTAFGAFALLLASIGLHGVTAYAVARRTAEIGVRVALGAGHGDVLWLILRQVVGITIAGVMLGVPAAIVSTELVRASLYGVAPADPVSMTAAVLVMTAVALAAGFFPARRAARLDPLVALRQE